MGRSLATVTVIGGALLVAHLGTGRYSLDVRGDAARSWR
jgi:uncharacterized membrane protein YphA (DoxX/SURF4 family)